MNILFILPDSGHGRRLMLGVAYISSVLKKNGHNIRILNFSKSRFFYNSVKKNKILHDLKEFKPALIGISVLSSHQFKAVKYISDIIKAYSDIPVIAGGTAVSVDPDPYIEHEAIDMICIGEGELAMLDLASRISAGKYYQDIDNIWLKRDDRILRNRLRPPVKDLDSLPFPDRSQFKTGRYSYFLAGRGCDYACAYCASSYMRSLYLPDNYVRYRSPGNIIKEIMEVRNSEKISIIWFYDDVFPSDISWLKEFAYSYKKYIGKVPFTVNARIEQCSEEFFAILKNAGLFEIRLGIESADDSVRKNVLNRHIGYDEIREAFKLAEKYGIRRKSYNIIGAPEDTKDTVFKSIMLNLKINPENVQYSIFQPYPGTELYKRCSESDYIIKEAASIKDYYREAAIATEKLSSEDCSTLFLLAQFVKYNSVIFSFIYNINDKLLEKILNICFCFIRYIRKRVTV